jgi:hypothetical protein
LRKRGVIDDKADRYATENRKPIETHLAHFVWIYYRER